MFARRGFFRGTLAHCARWRESFHADDAIGSWRIACALRRSPQIGGIGLSRVAATWQQPLVQGRFPNTEWKPGTIVADWAHIALPGNLEPGVYRLEVRAVDAASEVGEPVVVGTITIEG